MLLELRQRHILVPSLAVLPGSEGIINRADFIP